MLDPVLVSTWFSPWSERVRWVLDHHGIVVRRLEHVPFLGERRLRRLAGSPAGRVSVPLLIDGGTVVRESWDIARWAEARATRERLIPPDREVEVRGWVELADAIAAAGRGITVAALARSPGALDEALPPFVPSWVRPLLRPVGRYGMRWFGRKYTVDSEGEASRLQRMRAGLDRFRAGLSAGGGYLIGSFSYADIALATVLQGVSPVDNRHIRLGPSTRAAWTIASLARDYADLVAWRDDLYARHRPPRAIRAAG